jgi:hypothetical protein
MAEARQPASIRLPRLRRGRTANSGLLLGQSSSAVSDRARLAPHLSSLAEERSTRAMASVHNVLCGPSGTLRPMITSAEGGWLGQAAARPEAGS